MYFIDRIQLGQSLAQKMGDLRAQDTVIICINEKALGTSIGMATSLRAWIYPLLTEPIVIPGDPRIIGVVNQDGVLCYNPGLSTYEREELEMEYQGIIQDASRAAFSKLNRLAGDYGQLNKHVLNGRTVIICGDIIDNQREIGAAIELLKSVRTKSIVGVAGNVVTDVADALRISVDKVEFMDVMTNMFDDDHYFEQPEKYTVEERRRLAMNISHYWV